MYIIELLVRLKERLSSKSKKPSSPDEGGTQDGLEPDLVDETLNCNHIFVPIDSTKEILACSKCGYLIHKKDIPKKDNKGNFFLK